MCPSVREDDGPATAIPRVHTGVRTHALKHLRARQTSTVLPAVKHRLGGKADGRRRGKTWVFSLPGLQLTKRNENLTYFRHLSEDGTQAPGVTRGPSPRASLNAALKGPPPLQPTRPRAAHPGAGVRCRQSTKHCSTVS